MSPVPAPSLISTPVAPSSGALPEVRLPSAVTVTLPIPEVFARMAAGVRMVPAEAVVTVPLVWTVTSPPEAVAATPSGPFRASMLAPVPVLTVVVPEPPLAALMPEAVDQMLALALIRTLFAPDAIEP